MMPKYSRNFRLGPLNNKLLKKLKIFSNYFIFFFGSTRYSAMMRSSFRLEDIN